MNTPARALIVSIAGLAAILAALPASARSRSDNGDSYLNDEVRNPRFVEPGGYADSSRYRISNPAAGFDDRQLARQGVYSEGSGYYPARPRGRVFIQPYYAR